MLLESLHPRNFLSFGPDAKAITLRQLNEQASRRCKTKAPYGKGDHSFKLPAKMEPSAVLRQSPWARRFDELIKRKP